MPAELVHYAYPLLVLALAFFFIQRLKTDNDDTNGSGLIYSGLAIIFLFTLLNLMEHLPGYHDWFLEGVYPVVVVLKFLVLAIGVILLIVGLGRQFAAWRYRLDRADDHLTKLQLLEQIQYECRRPYQTVELLDRVVQLLLEGLGEKCGAVYLYESERKGFDLVSSQGFGEREASLLKHYPLGSNIISESLDKRRALITADFRSFGGKAQVALTRFKSMAVFPLASGKSRLGAFLFFSEERSRYDEHFIELVKPITSWLAERLEVLRLGRDFHRTFARNEENEAELEHYLRKLARITEAVRDTVAPSEYTRVVKELIDIDAVYLVGIINEDIHIYGGTTDRIEFSKNFSDAIKRSISRGRTVVLNQEEDNGEEKDISGSTLLLPIGTRDEALLLQRHGDTINLTEREMKSLQIAAAMAGMVISHENEKGLSSARARVFEGIERILRIKSVDDNHERFLSRFVDQILEHLPPHTVILLCRRKGESLHGTYCNVETADMSGIEIEFGESIAGRAAAMKEAEYAFGYTAVSQYLGKFQGHNKVHLRSLFGDEGVPAFMGCYPILIQNRTEYLLMAFEFNPEPLSGRERHQYYSIATGMINIRIEINSLEKNMAARIEQAEKAEKGENRPIQEPLQIKPKQILVVADQKVILDLVTSMCESLGHLVLQAKSPTEGFKLFERSQVSAVLADMSTADTPEEEVKITDLARSAMGIWDMFGEMQILAQEIPIIAMTGAGNRIDRDKYKAAGVHGVLYKPFQISQLAQILNRAGIS